MDWHSAAPKKLQVCFGWRRCRLAAIFHAAQRPGANASIRLLQNLWSTRVGCADLA